VCTSEDGLDIRVLKLTASVHPQPTRVSPLTQAAIEILASIGENVQQEIPVINYSNKDWTIRVALQNENVKASNFSGSAKEFTVKRKYRRRLNNFQFHGFLRDQLRAHEPPGVPRQTHAAERAHQ